MRRLCLMPKTAIGLFGVLLFTPVHPSYFTNPPLLHYDCLPAANLTKYSVCCLNLNNYDYVGEPGAKWTKTLLLGQTSLIGKVNTCFVSYIVTQKPLHVPQLKALMFLTLIHAL